MSTLKGTIKSCLILGEYDQGDVCHISYDELYSLKEKLEKLGKGFDDIINHIHDDPFSETINGNKVVYSESLIKNIEIIKSRTSI